MDAVHRWLDGRDAQAVQKVLDGILPLGSTQRSWNPSIVVVEPEDLGLKNPVNWAPGVCVPAGARALALYIKPPSGDAPMDTRSLVMCSLSRMKRREETTVEAFVRALKHTWEKSSQKRRKQPRQRFLVLCPIWLRFESKLRSRRVTVLGRRFSFITKQSMLRQMTAEQLKQVRWRFPETVAEDPRTVVRLEAEACDPEEIIEQFEGPFDVLRGLLELTCGLGHTYWHGGRVEHQRALFPCCQRALVLPSSAETEPLAIQFTSPKPLAKRPAPLSAEAWTSFLANARTLRRPPAQRSTLDLVRAALRLYVQGLDAHFAHHAFLAFWQLAEVVTRAELSGGRTDRVTKRLSIFNGDMPGVDAFLSDLADRRNRIVHEGETECVDDEAVNLIKVSSERALVSVLEWRRQLPSADHLEQFYRYYTENNISLERTESVVRFLRRQRGGPRGRP